MAASKNHLSSIEVPGPRGLYAHPCDCLTEFYRAEFAKHHQCLERQREYYSEGAFAQAEDALMRLMSQLEELCQREDACEVMTRLLRQFDAVTKLSAWTEPKTLH